MLAILVASPYSRHGSRSAGPAASHGDRKLADLAVVRGLMTCPARELTTLVGLVDEVTVDDGYVLARPSSLAGQAWIVVSGTVLVGHAADGPRCVGRGQVVGLAALDRRGRCGLSATVAGWARLQVLSVPAWQSLQVVAPAVAAMLLRRTLG